MNEYEWPSELDVDVPGKVGFSKDLDFAALQPRDTTTMMALMRIREHNQRRHRNMVELERERINCLIAVDDQERHDIYLSIAILFGFVAAIWLVAWWLSK